MPSPPTEDAFRAASTANVATMSRDELAEHLVHLRIVRSWSDAAEITANRRARELAAAGAAGSAEAAHVRAGQRSEREARAVTDRADVCAQMPGFESALAAGSVSAGHLDAIARATAKLDDTGRARLAASADNYLDQATRSNVDAFERAMRKEAAAINAATAGDTAAEELVSQRRRSNVKRWIDKVTGMHHTLLELDPLRDAEIWTAIDAQLATDRAADGNANTAWSELRVQSVVNAINSSGSPERRPEVNVLVSFERLVDQASVRGVCETIDGIALPVSTVRRLCCDADVFPTVLGADGEALDVGRTRRTATRSQRRALAAMHRSCVHPDCSIGFDACRIHHVRFWTEHHGPSDLDNLIPLCERHHHAVHDGGWGLTMTPDRVATWTRPDGESTIRAPPLTAPTGRAHARHSLPDERRSQRDRKPPGQTLGDAARTLPDNKGRTCPP